MFRTVIDSVGEGDGHKSSRFDFCFCDKTLAESKVGEKGFISAHSSKFQSHTAGAPRQRELKTPTHFTPTVKGREKQMRACLLASPISPLLHSSGAPCLGNVTPTLGSVSSRQ